MQFKPFEAGIEVSGRAVFSTLNSLGDLKISSGVDLLGIGKNKNGIIDIDQDKWYSQEQWLKLIEFIAKMYGDAILFKIGFSLPDYVAFPINGATIETAIKSIDITYHQNHKKNNRTMYDEKTDAVIEGIGHYGYQKIESHNLIISVCNNPYPCTFDKGILTSMSKKFKPNAIAYHDDSKPCRKNGADSCTYIITW
jgi:hypothetical protein